MVTRPQAVLVAEARPEIRDLVVRGLAEIDGFEVRGCLAELADALAAIDAFGPDALVFGTAAQRGSESAALRGIREARPELPVVLFSPVFLPGSPAVREALALGGCTRLSCTAARYAPGHLPDLVKKSLGPWIRRVVLKPAPASAAGNFLHLEVPSPDDVRFVRELVRQRTAIALDPEQEFLVHVRLAPLAKRREYSTVSELVQELRKRPFGQLHRDVIDAMLASQSSFFRDAPFYRALHLGVLPELVRRRSNDRRLDVWCVACATGQEPYSVAMLMAETFPVLSAWSVRFVASEASRTAIEKAGRGRYDDLEVSRGVPIKMLGRYFVRNADGWEVTRALREQIEFLRIPLIEPWPALPTFDLVALREVLIYLEKSARGKVVERLSHQVRPGGLVVLGACDPPLDGPAWERTEHEGAPVYRRRA